MNSGVPNFYGQTVKYSHVTCESSRDIVLLRGLRRSNFESTAPGRDAELGGGLVVSCNECRLGWTLVCVQLCAARAYRLVVAAVDHNVNLGGVPAVVVFHMIAEAVTLLDSAADQVQGPLDCLGPRRDRAHVGDCSCIGTQSENSCERSLAS